MGGRHLYQSVAAVQQLGNRTRRNVNTSEGSGHTKAGTSASARSPHAMADVRLPTFTRLRARFVKPYREGVPTLLDATGNEREGVARWRTAYQSARGALVTIGANELSAEIAALEQALQRTGSRVENRAQAQALQREFLRLVTDIAALKAG